MNFLFVHGSPLQSSIEKISFQDGQEVVNCRGTKHLLCMYHLCTTTTTTTTFIYEK
jgi:hypothetical protein